MDLPRDAAYRKLRLAVETDAAMRKETFCRGCGNDKGMTNMLVCWDCFKRRKDITPLKYAGEVHEWLETLPVVFGGTTGKPVAKETQRV